MNNSDMIHDLAWGISAYLSTKYDRLSKTQQLNRFVEMKRYLIKSFHSILDSANCKVANATTVDIIPDASNSIAEHVVERFGSTILRQQQREQVVQLKWIVLVTLRYLHKLQLAQLFSPSGTMGPDDVVNQVVSNAGPEMLWTLAEDLPKDALLTAGV